MKQFIKFLSLMVIAFLFLTASLAFAEKVTFVKEYNYNASDLDSKVSSRAIALEQVKRLLLEELGTYLISETEVKNFRLTKDQVTTYSAGVVSAEVIDEKWDGKTYYLKAKVSADPVEVTKALQNIVNDKQKSKDLEDVRKKASEFSKEIERLKKELEIAKADTKKPEQKTDVKIQKVVQYNDAVSGLRATDWVGKGKYLEGKGEIHGAIDAYTKAIELNPEDPITYFLRGGLYFKTGNDQNALGDIEKAKKFTHSNSYLSVRLCNLQAAVYLKIGNYSAALESLEELIRRRPNLTFLEWKIEIEDINKIIKKFPNDFRGYIVRGLYYGGSYMLTFTDKTGELSIADYKRALSLNPKYALGYYLLGEAYSNKTMFNFNIETPEEYQSALKAFTKAIELNLKPSMDVNVFYERGKVYLKLENYKEAIKDFNKAIEVEPTLSFALEDRGDAYFELGNYRQALADYDNAIKLRRSDKSWDVFTVSFLYGLYKKKGDAYFKMGNYKQAINAYDKTVEYYHSAYVDKNYPNKNYPKGAAHPARPAAPAAAPGTPTALSLIYEKRGISHFELGNYELALRDLDEAIEIPPIFNAHADAYYYRGLAHEKLGNHQQAIKDVKVAAKRGVKAAQAFLKSKGIEW